MNYEELKSGLQQLLDTCKANGQLVFPVQNIDHILLAAELEIVWFGPSKTFPQGAYICSDKAGNELLRLAWLEHNAAAWDISSKIAAHRLALNEDLPSGVKAFAALVLSGQITKPKPENSRRDKNWSKRMLSLMLVDVGNDLAKGEISKTHGEDKAQGSTSESIGLAVAEVLTENSAPTTYKSIKQLLTDSKSHDVQSRNDYANWKKAVQQSMNKNPVGLLASVQGWLELDEIFGNSVVEQVFDETMAGELFEFRHDA